SEISAGFHSLLASMDSLERKESDLRFLEEKYRAAIANLPQNVIPLRRPRNARLPDFSTLAQQKKSWRLCQDCLVECGNAEDLRKMAFELHAQSTRYAFLNFADLNRECRMNASELRALGNVTLFIPDIMALSITEQKALLEMAKSPAEEQS